MNIRSLVNKFEQLKIELEDVDIDIFGITETWLTEGVSSNILNIKGYNIERSDRCFNDIETGLPKRGGGLCIYYSKQLASDTSKWRGYNVSSPDLELQIVEFCREKARNIILLNVYRPPNGNVENMVNHLNLTLSNIPRQDRKDIIVMGDFNVNMSGNDADKRRLIRFSQVSSLDQLIESPTRCTVNTSSMIDLIFSNMTHVESSGVLDVFISDHMPIYLVKKMNTKKTNQHVNFKGRTYRNYSKVILQEKINEQLDVQRLILLRDPVECWDVLYGSLVDIADEIVPSKEYKVKSEKPAWLTDELLNMRNDRDYFFKKAKISGDDGDWFVARNMRNRVNIAMRAAKTEYIKDQLVYNKNNPKKFWNLIHSEILPEDKNKILYFTDETCGSLYDQNKLPNLINDYFSEIGPTLARDIPKQNWAANTAGEPNHEKFELRDFQLDEMIECVKDISIHKSSGIPTLGTRFLKDTMLCIPDVFLHLYNLVKESCIFPNSWKIATVVPLPKCNNPKDSSELRPVSLLPLVGKILEKLIHSQLTMFLENTMYLSQHQHGFRKGYSTTSATAKFIDDIALGLDKGKYTTAVFLDIKKAFDTIDHKIIIKKLEHAGVGRKTLPLLANYLNNRKQCVLYNGYKSDVKTLTTGVPQGSTLGPLLFLIYVNDLPKLFRKTKCMMFADDTVLYHSCSGSEELYRELQSSLNIMFDWCNANQITLNSKKCEYVHFGYRKSTNTNNILKLGSSTLSRVCQYKYLGTYIDEKLNGEAQFKYVTRILSFRKKTFSKIRFLLDQYTAKTLYKTTIQPIFYYNDFFYYMLNREKQDKLQTMQNKILRLVYKNDNLSTEDMYERICIGKLQERRDLHLCGLMYKRSRREDFIDKRELPTRQFDKIVLKVPEVLLTKSFDIPVFKGSNKWNTLPRDLQVSPSYKEFKYGYKNLVRDRLL